MSEKIIIPEPGTYTANTISAETESEHNNELELVDDSIEGSFQGDLEQNKCLTLDINKCIDCSDFPCNLFDRTKFEFDLENLVAEHRNKIRCTNCDKHYKNNDYHHLVVNKHCDKFIYICQECYDDENCDVTRLD